MLSRHRGPGAGKGAGSQNQLGGCPNTVVERESGCWCLTKGRKDSFLLGHMGSPQGAMNASR